MRCGDKTRDRTRWNPPVVHTKPLSQIILKFSVAAISYLYQQHINQHRVSHSGTTTTRTPHRAAANARNPPSAKVVCEADSVDSGDVRTSGSGGRGNDRGKQESGTDGAHGGLAR